ncbi:MAG: 2-polyprenyl-3-methyl-6-methoxy-1,4-benzoquinone monooxygenase [Legionellales bacterium]
MRKSPVLDTLIGEFDAALRTLLPPQKRIPVRVSPAEGLAEADIPWSKKKHIAGLMRVNHAGEVCAQALYQGQALTAHCPHIKEQMSQAAAEETDHLAWCEQRLYELGSKTSILNPIWYSGSFLIGALAGLAGDSISLGFVAETERQVSDHLLGHLKSMPIDDKKTRLILERMQDDEEHHAQAAVQAGAVAFPFVIKQIMRTLSKLMTKSSYYL